MSTRLHHFSLVTLGIFLIGANLRLPITMIPPLLPELKETLGLSPNTAGFLTTIPLLMFAVLSPLIAKLGNTKGNEWSLLATSFLLMIGSYLRAVPNIFVLLFGTCLVGAGIAGGNVLLPAIIKDHFPLKIGVMTSLYTVSMGLVASFGTGLSGILGTHIGMPKTINVFSTVGLLGFVIWALVFWKLPAQEKDAYTVPKQDTRVWNNRLSWLIALAFGIQSLLYYSLLTWLPSLWQSAGFTKIAASNLATLFQISGIPLSLIAPIIGMKKHGTVFLSWGIMAGFILGTLGIMLTGTNFVLNAISAIIMGAASCGAFSLCIIYFQIKTNNIHETAQLSGFAQSFGYAVAAVGPILYGAIQNSTHSWNLILLLTILLALIMFIIQLIINQSQPLKKENI
ncbi:MFS transporter [Liquorilactobacillus uvarum]|uniref:MFS transporter n=1 Tax=Liquorilactobacillus uvarum TaxID=303240 RepID=UPI00070DD917|nr:MFS transporter [Liquorilactobacillus uvarum]